MQRVKLLIEGADKPPKLYINDIMYKVKGIEYAYETADAYTNGSHDLIVKYIDTCENDLQITIMGFTK